MIRKKLYSVYYREFYPFESLAKEHVAVHHAAQIDDPDSILILHGGADISPSIYKAPRHPRNDGGTSPSSRDLLEIDCAKRAIALKIPIMGICRGAQLMCALNGGSLLQHVSGHHSNHTIITYNGKTLTSNSVHHQMMYPWGTDFELLAWSNCANNIQKDTATEYDDFPPESYPHPNSNDPKEPEIVWFPKTKAFCVQGHPEWAAQLPEFQKYVTEEFLKRI